MRGGAGVNICDLLNFARGLEYLRSAQFRAMVSCRPILLCGREALFECVEMMLYAHHIDEHFLSAARVTQQKRRVINGAHFEASLGYPYTVVTRYSYL